MSMDALYRQFCERSLAFYEREIEQWRDAAPGASRAWLKQAIDQYNCYLRELQEVDLEPEYTASHSHEGHIVTTRANT